MWEVVSRMWLLREFGSRLFINVDGALLPIAPSPELVVAPVGPLVTLLQLSTQLGGALVSGRPLAQLDRLFALLRQPATGECGTEIRLAADHTIVAGPPPSGLAQVDAELVSATTAIPGVHIERKRIVVVYYRQAPPQAKPFFRDLTDAARADHVASVIQRLGPIMPMSPTSTSRRRQKSARGQLDSSLSCPRAHSGRDE